MSWYYTPATVTCISANQCSTLLQNKLQIKASTIRKQLEKRMKQSQEYWSECSFTMTVRVQVEHRWWSAARHTNTTWNNPVAVNSNEHWWHTLSPAHSCTVTYNNYHNTYRPLSLTATCFVYCHISQLCSCSSSENLMTWMNNATCTVLLVLLSVHQYKNTTGDLHRFPHILQRYIITF